MPNSVRMKILDVPRSGSYGGVTSSRNRNGQYVRSRAIPVQPRTVSQLNTRARQAVTASAWRALTANQRQGWSDLGAQMTRSDALGQSYNLTGFQAAVSVNNILLATGGAALSDAPALVTPPAVISVTLTLTHLAMSVAFTPTPLAAGQKVIVRASPQRSAGRNFEADFRVIFTGAAASASPADIFAAYSAKFGVPVVGNKVFVSVSVMSGGFESISFLASGIVT